LRHGAYKVVLDGKSYRATKPVPKNTKNSFQKAEKTTPKGGENS
jgi:hypothetical protein